MAVLFLSHPFLVIVLLLLLVIFLGILRVIFMFWWYRLEPLSSASAALQKQLDGLETRKVSGGVAFIPADAARNVGLVYLQGALVHSQAYAPLCSEIANLTGGAVIIMELPCRMATLGQSKIAEAMSQVPEVSHWAIGGHSLGGSAAAKFIFDTTRENKQKHLEGQLLSQCLVVGLLLHASYTGAGQSKKWKLADRDDISVLQIDGDKDEIIDRKNMQAGKAALPSQHTLKVVAGCNHSGFGHYGPQVFPRTDGEAAFSKEELQHIIAELTASWLKSLTSRFYPLPSPLGTLGA